MVVSGRGEIHKALINEFVDTARRMRTGEEPSSSPATSEVLRRSLADHVVRNRLRQTTLDVIDRPTVDGRIIIDAGHC